MSALRATALRTRPRQASRLRTRWRSGIAAHTESSTTGCAVSAARAGRVCRGTWFSQPSVQVAQARAEFVLKSCQLAFDSPLGIPPREQGGHILVEAHPLGSRFLGERAMERARDAQIELSAVLLGIGRQRNIESLVVGRLDP